MKSKLFGVVALVGLLNVIGGVVAQQCAEGCYDGINCMKTAPGVCHSYRTTSGAQGAFRDMCDLGWHPSVRNKPAAPAGFQWTCMVVVPNEPMYTFICSDCDPDCAKDVCSATGCTECYLSTEPEKSKTKCELIEQSGDTP